MTKVDMEEEQEGLQEKSGRFRVFQAAGLVAALLLLSRIMGLVREIVTRSQLGTDSLEAVAYEVAIYVPEAIFFVIAGGAIGSAFIPTFAAYFVAEDEEGGWRLFSAVLTLLTLVVTLICALAMWQAPSIANFFYPTTIAARPEIEPLIVRLMRIMLLSPIIFGASGVVMGTLNARQHFFLPALAPTIYNLGIIIGALVWEQPVFGLAYGTVLGAVGHLLVQLPALRQKKARFRPILTTRDPGVRQVLRLMAPRVLGLSFSQLNRAIITGLTDIMPIGSLPAFNTAFRLVIMPQGILGQALGIAAFPTMSELAAREAWDEMRQILTDSLRLLLFFGLPVMVLLIILRRPIITILFERGEFTASSTTLTAGTLLFLALGLIALILIEVLARAFYSLSDTWTPVLAGFFQIGLMGALGWWLSTQLFPDLGLQAIGGLALAFSLSNYLEVALLLWLLSRRLGGINGRLLFSGAWRMTVAALGAGALGWGVIGVLGDANWLQAVLGTATIGSFYFVISWLLGVKELHYLLRLLPIRQAGK